MKQQKNSQDLLANAARTLYGSQRKKDEEEKSLRNSLLNELGDKAEAKHILYSSNEELMKMRDEINAKKLNTGDKEAAIREFDRWIYDNGKVQKGLINRRKKEKELFLIPIKE